MDRRWFKINWLRGGKPPAFAAKPPLHMKCQSRKPYRMVKFQEADMTLLQAATDVRLRAYAPYSRFKVGAAIRAASGAVYVGCNVENVAYPEGTCAEAGAIAAMIAGGDTVIAEVCVIADSPEPVPPCGGCRQKIAEFAGQDVVVTLCTTDGKSKSMTLASLLPGLFTAAHMDRS